MEELFRSLEEVDKNALSTDAIFKFYKHNETIKDNTKTGLYSLENEIYELILEYFKEKNYNYELSELFKEVVQLVEAYVHGNRYFNGWIFNLDRKTLNDIRYKINRFIEKYNCLFGEDWEVIGGSNE